jgi:hypothetical protein
MAFPLCCSYGLSFNIVMPALVAGIHVLLLWKIQDVDGRAFAAPKGLRPRRRDKPGHDEVH